MGRTRLIRRAVMGAAAVTMVAGCGADTNDALPTTSVASEAPVPATVENKISGDEREFQIHLTAQKAKAGEVTFTITNYGTVEHEFLIVKTDLAPGAITVGADGKFDEEGPGVDVLDEISEFEPGTTGSVTLNLPAGNYQLVCNIPSHYSSGMYVPFEVVA